MTLRCYVLLAATENMHFSFPYSNAPEYIEPLARGRGLEVSHPGRRKLL